MFKKSDSSARNQATENLSGKSGGMVGSMLKHGIKIPGFKPIDGENAVRLLPPLENDEFTKFGGCPVWTIYAGGATIISPTSFNMGADPILAKYKKYKDQGKDKKAANFKGTRRILNYVLDYNPDEDRSVVKIWVASTTLVTSIIKRAKDRRTGNILPIDDPEDGRIIFFEKTGTGLGTRYGNEAIDDQKDPLPNVDAIAAQMKPFVEVLNIPSQEELENLANDLDQLPDQSDAEESDVNWGDKPKGDIDDNITSAIGDIPRRTDDDEEIAARIRAKFAKQGKTE